MQKLHKRLQDLSAKKAERSESGFTIIEVLIVLAIAGLILLIVFLAVPALQRNSRNTAIKSDAAKVLGAVSDFVNSNNGTLPTSCAPIAVGDATVRCQGVAGTTPSETKVKSGTRVSLVSTAAPAVPAPTGEILIATGNGCVTGGNAAVAKNRAVAALYRVEANTTATGDAPQCTES